MPYFGDGSNLTSVPGVPVGGIIMWSGATNNIPTGWALCDGQNGTPNLQDRFIVGAGSSYNVNDTGGEASVTLTLNQIPAHSHVYQNQVAVTNAGERPWPASNNDCRLDDANTTETGGGQSHENRPPYYALCFIMKT